MRKLHILTAILLLLFIVTIIPGVVSNYFSLSYLNETLETKEKKYQSGMAIRLSQGITNYILNYQQQFAMIARTVVIMKDAAPSRNPFKTIKAEDYINADPNIRALYLLDKNGQGNHAAPPGITDEMKTDLLRGFDIALEGQAFIGQHHYFEPLSEVVITFAYPIIDEKNTVIGVVEGYLSLTPIFESLPKSREGMLTYIVDKDGNVVLHSNLREIIAKKNYKGVSLVDDFHDFPMTNTITKEYRFKQDLEEITVLGTIAPVRSPDWGVVVQRDIQIASREGWMAIKKAVIIGVIFIVIAFLLGYVFAKFLSAPLQMLAARTREMAQGNFSVRAPIAGTSEISTLSDNFNLMAEQIEDYIRKLKIAAQENRDLFINSIQMISSAIDAKDPYTKGHSDRVRNYSLAVAKEMGFSKTEADEINISALLHDVGKIGIDDRVLRKPSALNDEEFALMKTHPAMGASIMERVPKLDRIIPGIKYHHENWGGGGYPDGLKGEEIPVIARIIAVGDTFDAMTTDRPYQKAMSPRYAAEKIRSMTGKRFNPVVVEAFLRAFEKGDMFTHEKSEVA